ncbi:hypothetical protein ABFS83_08G134700 [Erythranthe nasuta]
MKTQVEESFSDFYDKWTSRAEDLLQLVLAVSRDDHSHDPAVYEAVANKLTAHHKEYYTFKWAAAHEDILAFFTPVWLTPLENAFLWFTGWKPSAAFRLVESLRVSASCLSGLTEEQLKKIESLRMKIKADEDRVEREMERQQVSMADRKMVELAMLERRARRSEGGSASSSDLARVDGLVEVALKGLLIGLEKVMKMADCVRLKTLKGLMDIFSPMQGVNFLSSKAMLELQIKKCGQKHKKNVLVKTF